jgi:broad specificity phosphatase PhoE
MEKFKLPIAKHLEDEDDLRKKRDAELVPGQEERAQQMADSVYKHALNNDFKVLLFCVSPKKRAQETSLLVKKLIEEKAVKIPILVETDANLREIDQGEFLLPEDYEPGNQYEGLKKAGRIFSEETFSSIDPSLDNLNYHFGDPLLQEDGTYKYPELKQYFIKSGESYTDVLLRFYSQVVKLCENMERFRGKVDPVIFTHGQPHQIYSNLSEVAELIEKDGLNFEAGELPRICWNLYKQRKQGVVPFGEIAFVSIEHICNPKVIELLKREIGYLQSKQTDSNFSK